MDIAQEMSRMFDEEIRKTLFSSFEQCKAETREINPIDEIHRMKDKLTTVILCNSDEQEELQELADKESGFYKIIGSPYIEKGHAVIIKDEKMKMNFLSAYRNNGITSHAKLWYNRKSGGIEKCNVLYVNTKMSANQGQMNRC